MTPEITHLHSLTVSRALRQKAPQTAPKAAIQAVDQIHLSAEVREGESSAPVELLAALRPTLAPPLPIGAHATIRANVERALRVRHLHECDRLRWLRAQTEPGGSMDYAGQDSKEQARRLNERNCGAVGTALGLSPQAIFKLAQDSEQVRDGIRESQRYLNGEPSQLGQRGRQAMLRYPDLG